MSAVIIDPPHQRGQIKTGYAPKTGQPRDAAGRLILVWQYSAAALATAAPPPPTDAPAPVSRGILAETQGSLI